MDEKINFNNKRNMTEKNESKDWTVLVYFKHDYDNQQCYRIPWKEYRNKIRLLNVLKGFHYLDRMTQCIWEEMKYYYEHYIEIANYLNKHQDNFDENIYYLMEDELDQHWQILDVVLKSWQDKGYLIVENQTYLEQIEHFIGKDKMSIFITTMS